MLRVLIALNICLFLGCSSDQPSPVGPAGKVSAGSFPAPTNLRVEAITDTSARLIWARVVGADDYDLFIKASAARKWGIVSHNGPDTSTVVSGLIPNTQYIWTIKADSAGQSSDWAVNNHFSTLASTSTAMDHTPTATPEPIEAPDDNPYITVDFDGTLSELEQKIVLAAVADWERIVVQGHPSGLRITLSTNAQMWVVGQLGFARNNTVQIANDRAFTTDCFIGLLPTSDYLIHPENGLQSEEDRDALFKYVVAHEIGHCLGIGAGREWHNQIEYIPGWRWSDTYTVLEVLDNGVERVRYHRVEEPSSPCFTGENARREFMRLAENQWGDYPYVPLNWDRSNGSDPAHADSPILRQSVMSAGGLLYGSANQIVVSTIDAAFLKDIGYKVNTSKAAEIRLTAGYRDINTRLADGRLWGTIATETLYFPETALEFSFEDNHNKGYRVPYEAWVMLDDPRVRHENLFWHDESFKPKRAGKRTASPRHTISWCGLGHNP